MPRRALGLSRNEFVRIACVSGVAGLILLIPKIRVQPANKYYVSNAGSDGNSGTIDRPWQTIARVNSAFLFPGSQIYFKRGEIFSGQLTPTNSGIAGYPIVYGSYGKGQRPIVDGTAVNALLIYDASASYLRFENIIFSGATGPNLSTAILDTHDVYVYNCDFINSGTRNGLSFYSTSGSIIYNNIVDRCNAYGNHASGFFSGSGDGTGGPHDVLFINCISHDNGTSLYADHGFYVKFGAIIDHCISYNNSSAGFKLNCELVHNSVYYPVLKNSEAYANSTGIYLAHEAGRVYNNLSYSNLDHNIQLDPDAQNCHIYFNTFANITAASNSDCLNFYETANNSANIVKNNLIIQASIVNSRSCITADGALSISEVAANNTFDYNVYYYNGNSSAVFCKGLDGSKTFSQWKSLANSPDPHSTLLTDVPGLVTRYTDFHPAGGGNLIGLGIPIAGYSTDKDGNPRPDPPTPGCLEVRIKKYPQGN